MAQADDPVAAVAGEPDRIPTAPQRGQAARQRTRRVWCLHADDEARAEVVEGRAQPAIEASATLRDDVPAGTHPAVGVALEQQHLAHVVGGDPVGGDGVDRIHRVGQCGGGHSGGLLGAARWAQPGLHPAGNGALGDDGQVQRAHRCGASSLRRIRLMSCTARAVPRTVPVTFERPARSW